MEVEYHLLITHTMSDSNTSSGTSGMASVSMVSSITSPLNSTTEQVNKTIAYLLSRQKPTGSYEYSYYLDIDKDDDEDVDDGNEDSE